MITADEDTWVGLAGNFARAVSTGQYARTYQLGHPGVTSLWVDLLGIGVERAAQFAGLVQFQGSVVTRRAVSDAPDFLPALAAARVAHATVNAVLIGLIGLLAWRLLGAVPALFAGLLLALDPFLVAHAQVIRMDSLQALLLCVALLCASDRFLLGGRRLFVAGGGLAFGLALLSKISTLAATPALLAIAVTGVWVARRKIGFGHASRRMILDGVLWLVVAAGAFALLWPAMWVTPAETLRRLVEFTMANSGAPPEAGNYFFGAAIADPGLLFYPVALAFRLTPLACLGLVLLVASQGFRDRHDRRWVLVGSLLICAASFVLVISATPKKFDRYLLPALPPLLVAAGFGLARVRHLAGRGRLLVVGLIGLASLHQVAGLPPLSPYPLAYFNPLLGGPTMAARTILVGWGEGMELAAAQLNALPDSEEQVVAAFHDETFDANLVGNAIPLSRFAEADYIAMPIDADQRDLDPPDLDAYLDAASPDLLVVLAGVDYVRTFRVPGSDFGQSIRVGRTTTEGTIQSVGERLLVQVTWQAIGPNVSDARPTLQLVDETDRPASGPSTANVDGRWLGLLGEQLQGTVRLASPARPGQYHLTLSLNGSDGAALPVTSRPPWTRVVGDRLVLSSVKVRYR
jgi:hypothetical protein